MVTTSNQPAKRSFNLGKVVRWYVIFAVLWALGVATLETTIFAQFGVVIGAHGVAMDIAAGTSWVAAFFTAIFIGFAYELFLTIFGVLWFLAFEFMHTHSDGHVRQTYDHFFEALVGLVLLGAALYATFSGASLVALGTAAHASTVVLLVAGVLGWLCTFAIGIFMCMGGITLVAAFATVITLTIAFLRGGKTPSGVKQS